MTKQTKVCVSLDSVTDSMKTGDTFPYRRGGTSDGESITCKITGIEKRHNIVLFDVMEIESDKTTIHEHVLHLFYMHRARFIRWCNWRG